MYKTIEKYWGKEDWIQVTPDYAFKRLTVEAGKTLLNHYHEIKEETFYIADGIGIITLNGIEKRVQTGDHVHIKPGDRHQIFAITNLIVLEASTPHLTDSIREVKE